MIDHNGITLVRKAILGSSLALNPNVCRKIAQLFQHLKGIMHRHPMEFSGSEVL